MDVELEGDSARITVGDRLVLRLDEPVTGHLWTATASAAPLQVEPVSRSAPAPGGAPGAGGQAVVSAVATEPGEAVLVLELKREWEPAATERREVRVVVEAAGP